MGLLKRAFARLPGTYTEFDGVEAAARRLQRKYETGDLSTETMEATAEGTAINITIKEAEPTTPNKLYQGLSDSQERGDALLAFRIDPMAAEQQYVAVLPSATVERTKNLMMAEIARVMD